MRRLAALAFALAAAATAHATPWRPEGGLPDAPDPQPITATGIEHPFARFGDFRLGVLGDAFVTFRVDDRQGRVFDEFELSRVQLGGFAAWRSIVGVNVTLESIRSSGANSYFGIDGDSIVPRFKWAFAEATPFGRWLSVRAGIVPDLVVPLVEASWDFRVQGPVGVERDGLFRSGDLGATVEAALPLGLGSLALQYGNGEGVHLPEQNNGKNTTVALRLAPLAWRLPGLLLHVLYRDGSLGAASAADSRLAGGVTYTGRRVGAGALATWAIGYLGVGGRDAAHLTAWARGELPLRLFLFARADLLWPDAHDAGSLQARVIAGAAWALPAIARVVVSYEGTLPGGALAGQVPSIEEHQLLVQVEARL